MIQIADVPSTNRTSVLTSTAVNTTQCSPSNRPDHTGTVLFRDYTRTPQVALCPHKRTYISEKARLLICFAMFVLVLVA